MLMHARVKPFSFPVFPACKTGQRPRLLRAAVCLSLAASIALGNLSVFSWAESATVPKVVEYHLPTGQTLYIKEDHSKPIVTIDTWVKTGSVNETAKINGVSHFLEHLLFKGTDKYKPGELDRILESRGAEFNAATSDDFTHFYITTATPYFEEALALHSDMMVHAAIPNNELPQERKVVQEEINRANDNPDRQMYVALSKLMYGTHGYGFDTLGPKENIANIPRDSIMEYYHYWYQPQNFNTVIVGDVNPEQVKALVEKDFPAPPFRMPKDYQAPKVGPVQSPTLAQAQVMENPNISQAYLAIGMLGPAQQKPDDVYALDIATLALGSGKSSRLYRALKESKPLATSISASNFTQKYSGLIVVDAEAKPENREAVKKEVLQQLVQLKEKGITQEELDKAKTQYLKDFIFENETTDGTANSIGYNVTIGNLQDYLTHVQRVEAVTLDRVQAALNQYIDLNRAVMVELLPTALKANLKAETDANIALLKATAANQPTANTSTTSSQPQPVQQPTAASTASQPSQAAKSPVNPPTQSDKQPTTPTANQVTQPTPAPNTTETKAETETPAAPAAAPVVNAPQKMVLPNGMTLLSKPLKDSSTVAVKIFVKGGQGVETIPGTSTLTGAVMMQGTRSRTAEQISRELESKGMNLSVSADDDYIEVTGTAIQEDLGELFMIMQDVLAQPTFQEAEIAKKKEQLRQALEASRDNPSSLAFENLSLALYPSHPYGNEGKRVEDNLDKITRQDLLDYYHLYFTPQNMVVSVVGNFDPNTLKNYLSAMYPVCNACGQSKVTVPTVPTLPKDATTTVERQKLSAVWMAQGWLAPPIRDMKEYAALKVLNSLIGSGMSSRLFVDLREKQGLAYVVGSMYPTREQASRFVIYIGTDPTNNDKVLAGFRQQVQRLKDEPVPAAELNEAKSKLVGGFALAHDTNINQAFYLGLYESIGAGYEFDANYPQLIQQVTPADVQQVAQKVFNSPSVLSVVKPASPASGKSH
jgi:zinc protease